MSRISNFTFLENEFDLVFKAARSAEDHAMADPRACCFYARRSVEMIVDWLYTHESGLKDPYSSKLAALLEEPTFRAAVAPEVWAKLDLIKRLGNQAVHSKKPIRQYDALHAVQELFHAGFWLVSTYTQFSPENFKDLGFDQSLIPSVSGDAEPLSLAKIKALESKLAEQDKKLKDSAEAAENYDAEIAKLKKQVTEAKKRNRGGPVEHDYSEAKTREYLIDRMLREVGWNPEFEEGAIKVREYEVQGMPNNSGVGYVDYVLWNSDGMPLAVLEAKRTTKDARIGRNQGKLYADCLERQFGQRPVILYSNGYKHWVWDDERYPPRSIGGFYTRDELELMIQRRTTATALSKGTISKEIAGRYYQEQAIRHITESMTQGQRKALVVMATGAGKTRTVIALCDLLQRCSWIKRVLFLADRNALVTQAHNAFKTHLPQSASVNLVRDRERTTSRVFLSTYPTMMGLIDDVDGGVRRFGPGYFDLIVIDEAHRSVYRRYQAIFNYFDSFLIGLTATPRQEVDRDTYRLFELARGVPTYAYELEQAVEDEYLLPPKLVSVPIRFPREGIKYDDLTEEEKEEWDFKEWDEDGGVPDKVAASAVNEWLFNENTVDQVLEHVMQNALRVDEGEKIGKTIIFAKNHKHAVFVQKRFDANYPHLKGKFARVIDNEEPYAQELIDKFSSTKESKDTPQIAISVDMLDTGIDVPDVVNLVFFKIVRSKTKFWQMIGRGTRLCPGLFGPESDKEFFTVFDFCGNFEFFQTNPEGIDGAAQEAIGTRLFRQRLELVRGIREDDETSKEQLQAAEVVESRDLQFSENLVKNLRGEVSSMNVENFIVRPAREYVEKFRSAESWENLSIDDYAVLDRRVAGLPNELEPEDVSAKVFDLLILRTQLAVLRNDPALGALAGRIREILGKLAELEHIPAIGKHIVLIQEALTDEYWETVDLLLLDKLREKLRSLIILVPKGNRKVVVTDFQDTMGEAQEVELPHLAAAVDRGQYKKKFRDFISSHEDHIVLAKIRLNEPLTKQDINELEKMLFESGSLGDRAQFEQSFGKQEKLGVFVRKLVGLDRGAAKKVFDQYLDTTAFNANQIQFISRIIEFLTENGVMDPKMLFEHPFTNFGTDGPISLFPDSDAQKIVSIIRSFSTNASAIGE